MKLEPSMPPPRGGGRGGVTLRIKLDPPKPPPTAGGGRIRELFGNSCLAWWTSRDLALSSRSLTSRCSRSLASRCSRSLASRAARASRSFASKASRSLAFRASSSGSFFKPDPQPPPAPPHDPPDAPHPPDTGVFWVAVFAPFHARGCVACSPCEFDAAEDDEIDRFGVQLYGRGVGPRSNLCRQSKHIEEGPLCFCCIPASQFWALQGQFRETDGFAWK